MMTYNNELNLLNEINRRFDEQNRILEKQNAVLDHIVGMLQQHNANNN